MPVRLLALCLVSAPLLPAQGEHKPQMIWQGEVEGAATLFVHGKHVRVETRKDGRISKQRVHFESPLPDARQDVRLTVSEGSGRVRIVEQPRIDNQYTLAISIEGAKEAVRHVLALHWDDQLAESVRPPEHLTWSARVAGGAIISCSGRRCTAEPTPGAAVMHERFRFTHPLPAGDVHVALDQVEGRGEVRLIEQPSETNGYAARIQIRDPRNGSSDYSFLLSWGRPSGSEMAPLTPQTGLVWSGRVQGSVRVRVHGGAALSEALQGSPVIDERAMFDRPLPSGASLRPAVKKRQGRGDVKIVESPSNGNGYELVFQIDDTGPGADYYEVEVAW